MVWTFRYRRLEPVHTIQQSCRKRQRSCPKRQHSCPKRRHFVAVFGDCSRPKRQQIVVEAIVAENGNIVARNGNNNVLPFSALLVWTGHNRGKPEQRRSSILISKLQTPTEFELCLVSTIPLSCCRCRFAVAVSPFRCAVPLYRCRSSVP